MIKGKRITLRAITRDDLPHYLTWLNNSEVIYHLSPMLPMNLEDETEWYERQRKDETSQQFAIVINDGEQLIGSAGLMDISYRQQQAELGIFIGDKNHWNQGYGREAIQLLLHFAFTEMNLHRVFLRVDASHRAAIRCYQNCGFKEEGLMRDAVYHHGHFEDQFLMSILRSEYSTKQEKA